jgi:hypothetical protein
MMGEWEGEGEGEARRVPLVGPAPCAVSAPGKERGLLYQSRFVFCFSFFFSHHYFFFEKANVLLLLVTGCVDVDADVIWAWFDCLSGWLGWLGWFG